MGDIFWDFDAARDRRGEYSDPHEVAISEIERTLREILRPSASNDIHPPVLREEYCTLVSELSAHPTDEEITHALTTQAEWTNDGARCLVALARHHGTFILRSALALAEALGIEDGNLGR